MLEYFKSIIDQDNKAYVICDLNHTIIYMNPFAIEAFKNRGGNLVGRNLMDCHPDDAKAKINMILEWFKKDKNNNIVHTFYNEKQMKDGYMVALRNSDGELIGYYEKHEYRARDERPFYEM